MKRLTYLFAVTMAALLIMGALHVTANKNNQKPIGNNDVSSGSSLRTVLWSVVLASVVLFGVFIHKAAAYYIDGPAPRPPGVFFFGNMLDLLKNVDRLYDYQTELCRTYKFPAFQFAMPGAPPHFFLKTAANVEYFLKTNFNAFEKGRIFQENFQELLGEGIFAVDGEKWREKRKIASHMFSERVLRDDMHRVFNKHAKTVLQVIREKSVAKNEFIDLQNIFFQFTLDSICEIAFGQNVDALHSDSEFGRSFDRAQFISFRRFFIPPFFWKAMRTLGLGLEGELPRHVKVLYDFCSKTIADRAVVKDDELRKYPDLLSRFITEARDRGETLSNDYLRDVILNFMIAGRDTTACLLTWAVWELSRHPEEEKKLRAELSRFKAASEEKDWVPTYYEVAEMTYLDAFLNETLRLNPSVPSDGKIVAEDCILPDGNIPVKKGCQINFLPYATARLTSVWGPDAEAFNPSRWLTGNKVTPFQYPHFNAGPRTCLGQHVAILEAKVMFATLLNAFSLQVAEDHNPQYVVAPTMSMKFGLPIRFSPASSSPSAQ